MQTADILRSVRERFDALPVPVKIGMAAGGSVLLIAIVIGLFASGPTAPAPAATAGPAAVVVPPAGVAGAAPDAAAATAAVAAPTVVDVAPAAPPQILQLQRLRETWSVGTRAGDWKEVAVIERDARTFLFSSGPKGELAAMMPATRGRFFKVEATGYFRVTVPGEHVIIVNHSASDGNAGLFVFLNDSTIPLARSEVQSLGGYTRAAGSMAASAALTPGVHRLRVVARQDSVRPGMEVTALLRALGDSMPAPIVPGILTDEIITPTAPAAPATPAAAPATPAAPAPAATAVAPIAATATPVAPSPAVPGTPAAVPAAVPGTPAPAAVAPIAAAATPVAPRAAPAPAAPAPAAPVPAPAAPVR